jgi:hypothetical protein
MFDVLQLVRGENYEMSVLDRKHDDPPSLTLESIMAKVNEALDLKIKATFDDFGKNKLPDAIKVHLEPVTGQLGTINEALAKLVAGDHGAPPANPDSKDIPPAVNVQLKTMTEKLAAQDNALNSLKAAKEEAEKRAEKTERHAFIRNSLAPLKFINAAAAETAFGIVEKHVQRLGDGTLVADLDGSKYPVPEFAKDFLEKEHAYVFAPYGVAGSGAPSGGGAPMRPGLRATTEMIKPGMKSEDRDRVVRDITTALAESQAA